MRYYFDIDGEARKSVTLVEWQEERDGGRKRTHEIRAGELADLIQRVEGADKAVADMRAELAKTKAKAEQS